MSIFDDFDAMYGHGTYSGMPDGIGGTDIFHDGLSVDHVSPDNVLDSRGFELSIPNAEGGHDLFDFDTGSVVSHSEPNEAGGMNIFDGDMHLNRITTPNVEGGTDFYDSDMRLEGWSTPNEAGSEDFHSFGHHGEGFGMDGFDATGALDHHAGFGDHDMSDVGDHHFGFDGHGLDDSHFDMGDDGLMAASHSGFMGEADDAGAYLDDTADAGNLEEILAHEDPLMYSSDFHLPKLLFPMMILMNRRRQASEDEDIASV